MHALQGFSLPLTYEGYKVPAGKKNDPLQNLIELIKQSFKLPSEEQKSENYRSIAFTLHEFLPTKRELTLFIEQLDRLSQSPTTQSKDLCFFLQALVTHGNLPQESLVDIKHGISRNTQRSVFSELLALIDVQVQQKKQPIPQPPPITPKTSMLAWMNKSWDAAGISAALTELCMPFYRLRAGEFRDEQNLGENLSLLNKRCASLTDFVATSILSAATESQDRAKKVTVKWLAIAESLHERNNYHMLFAIHNGLHTNAVERLEWLFESLANNSKATFKKLNGFFNILDKMKQLTDATEQLAGKRPVIPCIYWIYNKALLSHETPLYIEDGSINIQKFTSASNIFRTMAQMQSTPYETINANGEVLSYFECLDTESVKADDDKLRQVSNLVRANKNRSWPTLKNKPISFEEVFSKKETE